MIEILEKYEPLVRNKNLKEIIRFAIVGCLSVVIQYLVYYGMLLVVSYNVAYTLGYVVSFCANYILTTSYTFKTERNKKNGLGFIACHVINYFLQVALLNLFVAAGFSTKVVPIPVLLICVPTNFVLVRMVMKRKIFKDNL
jgi:putative flippase GtrA